MSSSILPSARSDDGLIHAALLYRDPELLRVVVTEFIADAVREATPVLVVLPTPSLRRLQDVLEPEDASTTLHDMTEVGRNPACLLGMLEDWMAAHPGPARIVSEPMWPQRSPAEARECLRHEALINHAFADVPASFLCPYDAEHLSAEVIAGAEMTHPHLLDETGARPSLTFGDPLAMAAGEPWPLSVPPVPMLEYSYEGDLSALRHDLAGDPLVAELGDRQRDDLVFAINEAVTNALRHGDGQVITRVWREHDHIVSEVTSTTGADDPYAGRRRPPADAPGGRGLWLINQLCDLVELRCDDDGMRLRLHVDLAA
jgi:anti-sigma regulatory factor (Ser/Thr protein kinase)